VSTDAGPIFIRLGDIGGANRDEPAVPDLKLTMELKQSFMLPSVFGQKPPRLRTSTIGCWPCNSESLRRLVVWSGSS
jgi:hypothetical protein